MADNDNRTVVLGKKAFVSTLVAIMLNPFGIALGYLVGKWLQGPKLSVKTVLVDPELEVVPLNQDLVVILNNLEGDFNAASNFWHLSNEEQTNARKGQLSVASMNAVTSDAQVYQSYLQSEKKDLESNITITERWTRGQILEIVPVPLGEDNRLGSESPQAIVERSKNELLGIYRSALKEVESRSQKLQDLIKFLHDHLPDKRTGVAVIKVGVLNTGDSEGVLYPNATLHSDAGEIDLTASPEPGTMGSPYPYPSSFAGGYVVVPARSFREMRYTIAHSSRGDAAENWKKLVQTGRGTEVRIELHTGSGNLTTVGHLPI